MPEHTQQQLVYVVDDDQGMLDSSVWLFESMGLKALPFTNGQTFLDACDPAAAACVLLDVRMPGMGGLAVQDAMRERGIGLPVIFVSAHADVPIVVRAFRGGAVDFIEKPYLYRSRVMKRMQADSLPALVGMLVGLGVIDPFTLQPLRDLRVS